MFSGRSRWALWVTAEGFLSNSEHLWHKHGWNVLRLHTLHTMPVPSYFDTVLAQLRSAASELADAHATEVAQLRGDKTHPLCPQPEKRNFAFAGA